MATAPPPPPRTTALARPESYPNVHAAAILMGSPPRQTPSQVQQWQAPPQSVSDNHAPPVSAAAMPIPQSQSGTRTPPTIYAVPAAAVSPPDYSLLLGEPQYGLASAYPVIVRPVVATASATVPSRNSSPARTREAASTSNTVTTMNDQRQSLTSASTNQILRSGAGTTQTPPLSPRRASMFMKGLIPTMGSREDIAAGCRTPPYGVAMGPNIVQATGVQASAGGPGSVSVRKQLTPWTVTQEVDGWWSAVVGPPKQVAPVAAQLKIARCQSRHEAVRAAEANAPPLWHAKSKQGVCSVCLERFGMLSRRHHCRNCGQIACAACSKMHPATTLPGSYLSPDERQVRVCQVCQDSNVKFREALRKGDLGEVQEAYSSGCVNLRSPAVGPNVAEWPVHCAAQGGSLELLMWLVEDRCTPLFFEVGNGRTPLLTKARLSALAIAAQHGHIEMMKYLVKEKGCLLAEVSDIRVLQGCLEKFIREGGSFASPTSTKVVAQILGGGSGASSPPRAGSSLGLLSPSASVHGGLAVPSPSSIPASPEPPGGSYPVPTAPPAETAGYEPDSRRASVAEEWGVSSDPGGAGRRGPTPECIVCFENAVNCTFSPCGHRCCCHQCGSMFQLCPVCNQQLEKAIRTYDT